MSHLPRSARPTEGKAKQCLISESAYGFMYPCKVYIYIYAEAALWLARSAWGLLTFVFRAEARTLWSPDRTEILDLSPPRPRPTSSAPPCTIDPQPA